MDILILMVGAIFVYVGMCFFIYSLEEFVDAFKKRDK